jgi:hypothetical protein
VAATVDHEVSDVFEKYWDHLEHLDQDPDFQKESEVTQFRMTLFSEGLSKMAAQVTFELRPSAEARDKDVLAAEHAAISRLRRIQDRLGCWAEHRSSVGAGSGGLAPG